MKKFEIINNMWIKQLVFSEKGKMLEIAKINSISFITSSTTDLSYIRYTIHLQTDSGSGLRFTYTDVEKNQYENDLDFFENLLCNK